MVTVDLHGCVEVGIRLPGKYSTFLCKLRGTIMSSFPSSAESMQAPQRRRQIPSLRPDCIVRLGECDDWTSTGQSTSLSLLLLLQQRQQRRLCLTSVPPFCSATAAVKASVRKERAEISNTVRISTRQELGTSMHRHLTFTDRYSFHARTLHLRIFNISQALLHPFSRRMSQQRRAPERRG
jgi:hypothetical protein